MRRRRNGWQAQSANNGTPPLIIWEPTEWEQLLNRLQIDEAEAVRHSAARKWIRGHYMRKFVPERILQAIGLEVFLD